MCVSVQGALNLSKFPSGLWLRSYVWADERKKERQEDSKTSHMKKHPPWSSTLSISQATGRIEAGECKCASSISARFDWGVENGQCVLARSAEGYWQSARERSHSWNYRITFVPTEIDTF